MKGFFMAITILLICLLFLSLLYFEMPRSRSSSKPVDNQMDNQMDNSQNDFVAPLVNETQTNETQTNSTR